MTDYQHIANDVRDFIEGIAHTPDQATQSLAQAYAAACNEVNARLRRCGDLLRRGLRAEALHAAQASPDLLDVVAILDVPEIVVWENACAMNDLTRPPRLLVEIAAELNEAYATQGPLQSSLDDLRLLALARAPLIDRLRATRRLRALDPGTPHWTQDVAELERATLDAVRIEAAQVVRAGDGPTARKLIADLTAPDWQQPPADDVVEALGEVAIRSVVQELSAAQTSGDARAGRRALNALNKLLDKVETALPADLNATVTAAKAWIADQSRQEQAQQRFDEVAKQLMREIDAHAPPANLRALHARLRTFGRPIPADVEAAYRRSVGVGDGRAVRFVAMIVLAIAVLVGIVLAGVWWSKTRSPHGSPASQPRAAIGVHWHDAT